MAADLQAQREMTLQEWCDQLPAFHRVNKELAALRAEAWAVGWIPIESAPNTDSPASIHVLVWLPEFGARLGQYTKFYADTGEWPWSADLFSKLANKTITHWQPLPGSP